MTFGFIHQKRRRKLAKYDTHKDRKTTISFSMLHMDYQKVMQLLK